MSDNPDVVEGRLLRRPPRGRQNIDHAVLRPEQVGARLGDLPHEHYAILRLRHDHHITGLQRDIRGRVALNKQLLEVHGNRRGLSQDERTGERCSRGRPAGDRQELRERPVLLHLIGSGVPHLAEEVHELPVEGSLSHRDDDLGISDELPQLGRNLRGDL